MKTSSALRLPASLPLVLAESRLRAPQVFRADEAFLSWYIERRSRLMNSGIGNAEKVPKKAKISTGPS